MNGESYAVGLYIMRFGISHDSNHIFHSRKTFKAAVSINGLGLIEKRLVSKELHSNKHVAACDKETRTRAAGANQAPLWAYDRLANQREVTSDTPPSPRSLQHFCPRGEIRCLLLESGFLLNGTHPKVQRHNRQAALQAICRRQLLTLLLMAPHGDRPQPQDFQPLPQSSR
jgi:hypothetical protein